jgi:hypothetical protein
MEQNGQKQGVAGGENVREDGRTAQWPNWWRD